MSELNTEIESGVDTGIVNEGALEREAPAERLSVRESLERTFKEAREPEEKPSRRDERRGTSRRDNEGKFQAEGEETEQTEPEAEETSESASEPPAAWTAEAKQVWAELPEQVKAAVLKREADTAKGVENLKAQYKPLDDALAPHIGAIRQFNKTPAEAVAQLFGWFQALSMNPDQAFPALIKSYNYDPQRLAKALGITAAPASAPAAEVKPAAVEDDGIPPAVKQYIAGLEEKLTGLQNQVGQQLNGIMGTFQEQSMAKTHETLEMWAKDKPYFAEVRTFMGHLLTPDPQTGIAPVPLKDGRVDLDTAYEMAVYANPQVRAKILAEEAAKVEKARAEKVAKEAKAQQEQADRARRASGSLKTSTPGAEPPRKQPTRGKSVRDSLRDAIEEHNA